ncbi:RagB/SusD family nutrient uptake outer membrane protein [Rufibacter glacialis]
MLDVAPETTIDAGQAYQNIFDADAAVIGVYGKFMNLAERHIILNELRADLLNVTPNAAGNSDLLQINYHSVLPENNYANPRPYYEVIINCNDVLHNFNKMVKENKITRDEYNHRYSDIMALRSWLYLQLGIQYGRVPYITDPLAQVVDLTDQSKFQRIEFEVLLDSLIAVTERIPYKEVYPTGSSLVTNIGGFGTQKFFVNKRLVLGDLHLWKGNYTQAATNYRALLETGATDASRGNRYFDQYRVSGFSTAVFNHAADFAGIQNSFYNNEWIWDLPFTANTTPSNPFIRLFANAGGSYLLKPSQAAIDKWAGETNNNLTPGDSRGTAVRYQLGQPVVGKYLQNFSAAQPFENRGNWFLARASLLHLRFAEAANRDGHSKLALALLQNGIKAAYTDPSLPTLNPDVTHSQQTFLPAPYNFDARQGDFPSFRGDWYRNAGIRGKVGLQNINFYAQGTENLVNRVEDALIHEAALELAFEGHRWQDLLRIARRRKDPAFLADKVYEKLVKANDPRAQEVRARLVDPNNWYLPFKM